MSTAWYPVSAKPSKYSEEDSSLRQSLSDLSITNKWDEILDLIEKEYENMKYSQLINIFLLLPDSTPGPENRTLLHEAALQLCSKNIFDKLISYGSSKTLKTSDGETAYDISKRLGQKEDILSALLFSSDTLPNFDTIKKMEDALHKLMRERVANLLDKHEVKLPQLSLVYEFGKFHFEVPGWLGGFNVEVIENGIQVDSFCRVAGGSEQRHVIEHSGNIKFIAEGEDYLNLVCPRQEETEEDD